MRVETLQIAWHDREPIFSVDFHHASDRLATGGADKTIKVLLLLPPFIPPFLLILLVGEFMSRDWRLCLDLANIQSNRLKREHQRATAAASTTAR